jgi:hypothetical protein
VVHEQAEGKGGGKLYKDDVTISNMREGGKVAKER